MSMKNPLTPVGIEPETFRFVAPQLNHCATAVPIRTTYFSNPRCPFISENAEDSNNVPPDGSADMFATPHSLQESALLFFLNMQTGPQVKFIRFHLHIIQNTFQMYISLRNINSKNVNPVPMLQRNAYFGR